MHLVYPASLAFMRGVAVLQGRLGNGDGARGCAHVPAHGSHTQRKRRTRGGRLRAQPNAGCDHRVLQAAPRVVVARTPASTRRRYAQWRALAPCATWPTCGLRSAPWRWLRLPTRRRRFKALMRTSTSARAAALSTSPPPRRSLNQKPTL